MAKVMTTTGRQQELTAKQKKLVDTLVARGCTVAEAAITAGYSNGSKGDAARVSATKALQLAWVREYYEQRMFMQLKTAAPKAAKVLADLVENADSDRVRLEAAKAVLDRSGFTAESADRRVVQDDKVTIILNIGNYSRDRAPLEGEAVTVD